MSSWPDSSSPPTPELLLPIPPPQDAGIGTAHIDGAAGIPKVTVLNPQSHPLVGGTWQVDLLVGGGGGNNNNNNSGSGDLRVMAADEDYHWTRRGV